jgi:hypothetical protein
VVAGAKREREADPSNPPARRRVKAGSKKMAPLSGGAKSRVGNDLVRQVTPTNERNLATFPQPVSELRIGHGVNQITPDSRAGLYQGLFGDLSDAESKGRHVPADTGS